MEQLYIQLDETHNYLIWKSNEKSSYQIIATSAPFESCSFCNQSMEQCIQLFNSKVFGCFECLYQMIFIQTKVPEAEATKLLNEKLEIYQNKKSKCNQMLSKATTKFEKHEAKMDKAYAKDAISRVKQLIQLFQMETETSLQTSTKYLVYPYYDVRQRYEYELRIEHQQKEKKVIHISLNPNVACSTCQKHSSNSAYLVDMYKKEKYCWNCIQCFFNQMKKHYDPKHLHLLKEKKESEIIKRISELEMKLKQKKQQLALIRATVLECDHDWILELKQSRSFDEGAKEVIICRKCSAVQYQLNKYSNI